ncbi:adenylosuccinate lyase [Bradyrhizobium sp. GM6.1]
MPPTQPNHPPLRCRCRLFRSPRSAKSRRKKHFGRSPLLGRPPTFLEQSNDPPLYPPGNGLDLGAADPVQDLVRDRGACGGRPCRARHDSQGGRQNGLGQGHKDATFDVARIDEIERETKHDVIAFLTHLAEIVGPEARFVHQGMTSSDVLDTCLNVQLTRAADLLLADLDKVLAALKKRALEHKMTPTIGRSHGIHAEPVTFGLKLAYAYAEFSRARERLIAARKEVATCAISGAVGTFAQIDPRVEQHVANAMGLVPEPISTQVIPRDRHAMYFSTLGVIASSVERFAVEIRHMQRTEVLEAEEFFSEGQKGSSAMPHKRNPVLSENLTGLSRMVRAYVTPALENVVLWHERDISHSSAERMMGPDATVTLDFALVRLAGLIDKLLVYPANMQKNLDRLGGLVHSQRVLLALTQKGASREDAYKLVQRNAMPVWRGEGDFLQLLKKDADVKKYLTDAEIDEQFDLGYHFKHVDTIFKRVFGES